MPMIVRMVMTLVDLLAGKLAYPTARMLIIVAVTVAVIVRMTMAVRMARTIMGMFRMCHR